MISKDGKTFKTIVSGAKNICEIKKNNQVIFSDYYEEKNYIQSTGTQYIESGVVSNSDMKFETKVRFLSIANAEFIFGSGNNSNYAINTLYERSNQTIGIHYGTGWGATTQTVDTQTDYTIVSERNSSAQNITINGVTAEFNIIWNDSKPKDSILIMASRNSADGTITGPAKLKMYEMKIHSGGTLVRDFIPCQLNATIPDSKCADSTKSHVAGDIGMWDVVNDKFYANSGTGAFIAG